MRSFTALAALLSANFTWAQADMPDPSFSGDGIMLHAESPGFDLIHAIAIQPDGRIVGVGYAMSGIYSDIVVVRLMPDGTFDPSFGSGGITRIDLGLWQEVAYAVTLQADGRILAAGSVTGFGTENEVIVRLDPDGTLDNTFGTNGVVFSGFVPEVPDASFGIAVQPDQRIVTVGSANDRGRVSRFLPDGVADPSFDGAGMAFLDTLETRLYAVHLLPDGSVLAAGYRFTNDSALYVCKLTSGGSMDPAFGTDGEVVIPLNPHNKTLTGMAVDAGGRILCSGYTDTGDSTCQSLVIRLLPNGDLDAAWGDQGVFMTALPPIFFRAFAGVVVLPDGHVIAAGDQAGLFSAMDGDILVARLDDQGVPDPSFGNAGIVQLDLNNNDYDRALAIAVDDQERIVLGGTGRLGSTLADIAFVRFMAAGTVDVPARERSAALSAWPVPASDDLWLSDLFSHTAFRVVDGAGRLMARFDTSRHIDVSTYPAGVYAAVTEQGEVVRFVVRR